MHSTVVNVTWKGTGHVPVLIDCKGEILEGPLLWLAFLAKNGTAHSTLKRNARAVKLFYDFWQHYSQLAKGEDRLRLFFRALIGGDPNLGWGVMSVDTAKYYISALNGFTDWLSEATGTDNPNPLVLRKGNWHSQLMSWARRYKTDLLGHLSKINRSELRRKFDVAAKATRRHNKGLLRRPTGIFRLESFHKLLIHETHARNVILYLLLGPGGLRISEVLNMLVADVLYDPLIREARIRLVDPVYGRITTTSLGREIEITREEFLRVKYGLRPRCELPTEDIRWAGWKGMKMHKPEEASSEVVWLHNFYGQMMWAAHLQYMKERAALNPGHPWYLVNQTRNVGEPLTARNAASLLKNACRRLNLPPPYNPHSLRHMFGDITANVMKLSLQHIQVALRHSSILSTMVYTEPSTGTVRAALRTAKG